ncbi:hypothetical protein Kpol_411p1, partial [Vanderwaltozyma polyspora DSM 70294]
MTEAVEPAIMDDKNTEHTGNGNNDDLDELRTVRGEGRYFGVLEQMGELINDEPRCNNCQEKGHFKINCPHKICKFCGQIDDHDSQNCNKSIHCTICQGYGHYRTHCPQKWKKIVCHICNAKTHTEGDCPTVWRSYVLKSSNNVENESISMASVYCYNCGLNGHFGDDCNQMRSSRVPNDDGSAFSGDNLSRPLKKEYYRTLSRERGTTGHHTHHSYHNQYEPPSRINDTYTSYNNQPSHYSGYNSYNSGYQDHNSGYYNNSHQNHSYNTTMYEPQHQL